MISVSYLKIPVYEKLGFIVPSSAVGAYLPPGGRCRRERSDRRRKRNAGGNVKTQKMDKAYEMLTF